MFIPGIFFWWGWIFFPKLTIPPNGSQIVCSKSFWAMNSKYLQIYHGNLPLVDNKRRNFFASHSAIKRVQIYA